MGQWTKAIMLGVKRPDELNFRDDDGAGIADRWATECAAEINAACEARKVERGYAHSWDVEHHFVPGEDDGLTVIGMWIACDASGREGVPDLEDEAVAIDEIETTEPYASRLREMRPRWDAFAAWAATQGVALPPPRLWLVTTEVA